MKITKIQVFQADLPLVDGTYSFADGKAVDVFDATIVVIHTDCDTITGYGEVVPLGPNYLPSYASGVRAGLSELAPKLIGKDPTKIRVMNALMDYLLKGHPYVKSAVDMACWDILGKATGLPVSTLLGGSFQDYVVLYRAIPQRSPDEMASLVQKYKSEGYSKFQLKLGGHFRDDIERIESCKSVLDPSDTLIGDANTGWLSHDALRVAHAVRNLDVFMEQPCPSFEECLSVRRSCQRLPFILDECVSDVMSVVKVQQQGAADVVNIKISKFGGLTKAKQAVDLCAELGLAMIIEDTWGGDITTAAILHLASTAPAKNQFASTDFNAYNKQKTADITFPAEIPVRINGKMLVPTAPGLGVTLNRIGLKSPLLEFS